MFPGLAGGTNKELFNTGKKADNLETSQSFFTGPNSASTDFVLSPIVDNFPCLTPITENIATQINFPAR